PAARPRLVRRQRRLLRGVLPAVRPRRAAGGAAPAHEQRHRLADPGHPAVAGALRARLERGGAGPARGARRAHALGGDVRPRAVAGRRGGGARAVSYGATSQNENDRGGGPTTIERILARSNAKIHTPNHDRPGRLGADVGARPTLFQAHRLRVRSNKGAYTHYPPTGV